MKVNDILTKFKERFSSTLRKPKFLQRKLVVIAAVALCVALGAGFLALNGDKSEVTVLMVDGKELAVISSVKQAEEILNRIEEEYLSDGINLAECATQITYDDTLVRASSQPIKDETLYTLLKDRLEWKVNCGAIAVNGEPVIYLANEETAQQTLEDVKRYYVPTNDGQVSVEEVGFVEDVQVIASKATFEEIKNPDLALETLIKGKDKIVQHEVKSGDSLWTIAKENNMTVSELREANPEMKGDMLKIGMLLNLVKVEPLVQVATTITTTVTEKIPYETIYKNDDSLWRGQQKVEKKGSYGSREVVYRITKANEAEIKKETLAEKLLQEPVSQVVIRGTKVMVASRGDGGNGILGWPTRGRITSAYGVRRGRSVHTGTDIDGLKGDPIFSAGDGVVLQAGWKGNYGNCVVIDHGEGLTTLYAHLSKINVSLGKQVKRGDIIGLMGSTGKSTGSHLHFEVRINGIHQNPMRFLEK